MGSPEFPALFFGNRNPRTGVPTGPGRAGPRVQTPRTTSARPYPAIQAAQREKIPPQGGIGQAHLERQRY